MATIKPNAPVTIVVVGNGMVGHRFLEKLTQYANATDPKATSESHSAPPPRFTLVSIGDEPLRHYNRMRLTEFFEHQDVAKLELAAPEWYANHGITLHIASRATAIDEKAKRITCQRLQPVTHDPGQEPASSEPFTVAYDQLVLATGASAARPRLPGASLTGVFVYRTLGDLTDMIAFAHAHRQREGLATTNSTLITSDQDMPMTRQHAVVIGGGLLGLEAAKALHDLGVSVRVINRGARLMSRQLDATGSQLLQREIESQFGISVLFHKTTQRILSTRDVTVQSSNVGSDDRVASVAFTDGSVMDDVFMVVFATGILPRDELARACGLSVATNGGGIIVNDSLATSARDVFAIGECVSHREVTYGLVAPGYEMADVLARNLTASRSQAESERAIFTGSATATKLKLMGMDVASFGVYFPEDLARDEDAQRYGHEALVYDNPLEHVYKKLVFSRDGKKLLGGILVGDASDFPRLTLLHKQRHDASKPLTEPPNEILLGPRGGNQDGKSAVLSLPDEAQICSCNNVTKMDLCHSIRKLKLTTLAGVKTACNAGTACGGCLPMVKDLLEAELLAAGQVVDKSLCEHFAFSRQELYQIIQVEKYDSFAQVLAGHGRHCTETTTTSKTLYGCEICKPTVASILASLLNQHVLNGERAALQDSNDRFLANLQKSGQFSVVPRVPGGEITPDKLITLGQVARQYDLYTKITGGQRVDLFGANKYDLPAIWEQLVDAGFESGHAYGKALRTVKSCVGSTWCRFGVQDAVGFAIFLENRYKGIRSPHKLKGGVSGCTRECAEARSKDFGLIATENGYNIYVGGNGGTTPKHAVLLASDVPEPLTVQYLDRYLMYYIQTADRLQRTSKWLDALDGGIDQLRRVVIDDALGIGQTLETQMSYLIGTYECEWKRVVEDPALRAQFAQFRNTKATQREVIMKREREQLIPDSGSGGPSEKRPPVKSSSRVTSPSSVGTFDPGMHWVCVGQRESFPPNAGAAVLYGETQLAVFHVRELCNGIERVSWFATQNVCPYEHAFVLAQGILGDANGCIKVTCPMHKRSFALTTGECLSDEPYELETFEIREDGGGAIQVLLPPEAVLEARLGTNHFLASSMQSQHDEEAELGFGIEISTESSGAVCGGGAVSCGDSKLDW